MRILKTLKENGLARDNIIFFSATMGTNLIGFFYHAFMGRVLGPADYGILGVLLSMLYLLNVFLNVIQTSIARFVSKFKARDDIPSVAYLFFRGLMYLTFIGLASFVIYLIAGIFLVDFLKIPFMPYFYQGILVPFVFLLALNRGVLQGLQPFLGLGLNSIAEGTFKLVVGIIFVWIGWGVAGAVWGVTASYIGAFVFSFLPLKDLFGYTKKRVEKRGIVLYSLPVLFILLALTALYSFDVFLVKHYFSESDAGFYAAATLLGKIVFFASISIAMVMFPKVSESYEKNDHKNVKRILNLSLLFISLIGLGILAFYFLFPELIIMTLFGAKFLEVKGIMLLFSFVYLMFSLIYALSMYNLSLHRYSFITGILLMNIVEVILIVLYHDTLMRVLSMVAVVFFMLLAFLFFYTYNHKMETNIS